MNLQASVSAAWAKIQGKLNGLIVLLPNIALALIVFALFFVAARVINVDKNAADPKAIDELKDKEKLSEQVELRQNKYLNNRIKQNRRFIKWLVRLGKGFKSFNTARRIIKGYEIMNMLRKGQVKTVERGAVRERVKFIAEIFGVAA